jgi:hypothetical protein
MRLLADTHVHVYPEFPLESVFASALANLGPGPDDYAGIFLAERDGEHWFRDLVDGGVTLPGGLRAEVSAGGDSAWLVHEAGARLLVVPGRQLVSAERIEVLCLTHDLNMGDGIDAQTLLEAIRPGGGVAVLPWSPGKWLGGRGRAVYNLVAGAEAGALLIGDTAMRPRYSLPPAAMRLAAARGMGRLAGTDPLPLPGDESIIGRYGVAFPFDPRQPTASIRAVLTKRPAAVRIVGRRSPLPESVRRWLALRRKR